MESNDLLEPRKQYQMRFKAEHHDNASEYFDKLTEQSKVDIDANAATMKKYYAAVEESKKLEKQRSKKRALKVFLIVMIIVMFIAAIIGIVLGVGKTVPLGAGIGICAGCVALAVVFIVLIVTKINPALKETTSLLDKSNKLVEQFKNEGLSQMAALNNLFDYGMSAEIVEKTLPLIKMDKNFNTAKFAYMHEKFAFAERTNPKESTLFVQPGSLLGNPFLIETVRVQSMINKVYTGSITITYTVRVPDGKGGSRTTTRTQVLTASVTKPAPEYTNQTWLTYASEAAPDLKFSRHPVLTSRMDEKGINKFVDSTYKKIEKKGIDDMASGFTPIGNPKFESLFQALNRTNEVQFRLLFTPLAQTSMCDLITSKDFFGDDFTFIKNNMLNHIKTEHSQGFDYSASPALFQGFDYEAMKKFFIEYNDNYFKNFFFDFAPLLCVPIYSQMPTDEYIFKKEYSGNCTSFETESLANRLNPTMFEPANNATKLILKSEFVKKDGALDRVNIHAYGFSAKKRVDIVAKMGGDGKMHNVPVEWIEYTPVESTTPFSIGNMNGSKADFNAKTSSEDYENFISKNVLGGATIFERGLFSFIPANGDANIKASDLEKIL